MARVPHLPVFWHYEMFASMHVAALELLTARLAQSVERKALNLVVVGSSPTVGVLVGVHAWVWLRSKGGLEGGAQSI